MSMGDLYLETSELEPPPSPLVELADNYSQCLALSREYGEQTITEDPDQEVDLDALEHFISARADLFAVAEANLSELTGRPQTAAGPDSARRELTGKVVAILEEMARMESQLTSFLNDRLSRMRQTIGQMKKTQPVFKRYGYLGGPRAPSRITRHE